MSFIKRGTTKNAFVQILHDLGSGVTLCPICGHRLEKDHQCEIESRSNSDLESTDIGQAENRTP